MKSDLCFAQGYAGYACVFVGWTMLNPNSLMVKFSCLLLKFKSRSSLLLKSFSHWYPFSAGWTIVIGFIPNMCQVWPLRIIYPTKSHVICRIVQPHRNSGLECKTSFSLLKLPQSGGSISQCPIIWPRCTFLPYSGDGTVHQLLSDRRLSCTKNGDLTSKSWKPGNLLAKQTRYDKYPIDYQDISWINDNKTNSISLTLQFYHHIWYSSQWDINYHYHIIVFGNPNLTIYHY